MSSVVPVLPILLPKNYLGTRFNTRVQNITEWVLNYGMIFVDFQSGRVSGGKRTLKWAEVINVST